MTFENPAFTTGIQSYNFTAHGSLTLQANMTYWLMAGGTLDQHSVWKVAPSGSGDTTPSGSGATYVAYKQSPDSGATWNPTLGFSGVQVNGVQSGEAVPEPAAAARLLPVLLLLASPMRLHRRASAGPPLHS